MILNTCGVSGFFVNQASTVFLYNTTHQLVCTNQMKPFSAVTQSTNNSRIIIMKVKSIG